MSETPSKPMTAPTGANSHDKLTVKEKERKHQILLPTASQALRTAHWVNTIAQNRPANIAGTKSKVINKLSSNKSVTQVEINHNQETDNEMVNYSAEKETHSLLTKGEEVHLATSEL